MPVYRETTCTMACNKLKRKHPYEWDLNIYRGCEHKCAYCYAVYSQDYMDNGDFFEDIFVKTNVAERLERQLSSRSWKREVVNIGGVTDSYQPAEKRYRLMPEILRLLIRYETPCIISTKSELILRDYDLIDELSRITYVNIAETITSMDETVRRKIEPGGAPSRSRFQALKAFGKTNASTGLHFMPVIPYITDSRENVDALYAQAKEAGVDYVLPGALYLRGRTRQVFFAMVKREFPELAEPLLELYQTGSAGKAYKSALYPMVNDCKEKYGLSGSYSKPMKEKLGQASYQQLSLFESNAERNKG